MTLPVVPTDEPLNVNTLPVSVYEADTFVKVTALLIAVAKLGKPFKNDTKLTKTFTIVLDA